MEDAIGCKDCTDGRELNFDLTRMVHTSDIVGVWPEGRNNQSADDHGSQGSG